MDYGAEFAGDGGFGDGIGDGMTGSQIGGLGVAIPPSLDGLLMEVPEDDPNSNSSGFGADMVARFGDT